MNPGEVGGVEEYGCLSPGVANMPIRETELNQEDAQLVRACAGGDAAALSELHRRYNRSVWNLLYRLVADRQMAEDLAEETFFRLWRKAGLFDERKGAFRTWLFRMATRLAFNHLKKQARRRQRGVEVALEGAERVQPGRGPEEAARVEEEKRLVRRAIEILAPRDRAVLFLRHFQGLDETECARVLGIPRGTVKSRTFYALRRLREVLEGMGVT